MTCDLFSVLHSAGPEAAVKLFQICSCVSFIATGIFKAFRGSSRLGLKRRSEDVNIIWGQTPRSILRPLNVRIGFALARCLPRRSDAAVWARVLLLTYQNAKTLIKVRARTDEKNITH